MELVRQSDRSSDDRAAEGVRSEGRFADAKTANDDRPRLRREHAAHARRRLPAGVRARATSAAGPILGPKGRDPRGRRVPRRKQILRRLTYRIREGASSVSRCKYRAPHSQNTPLSRIAPLTAMNPKFILPSKRSEIAPIKGGEMASPSRWMMKIFSA